MAEVLLLNPRKRRKARRKNPSPAQMRARAAFGRAAKARSRRANPARSRARPARTLPPVAVNPRRRRRSNPALRTYRAASRRRSNPMGLDSLQSLIAPMKEAAIMGAGAIGFEVGYAYINRQLPASLQASPGNVTAGSALKALITVVLGKALNRATKGLSMKAAQGSLVVQARDIVAGFLPSSLPLAGRMGYASPAGRIVNMSPRVGPNRTSMGAYMPPGATALLNAYMPPGITPLLNGTGERAMYVR